MDTLSKLIAQKPPKHALTWGYNAAVSALGKARQLDGARDLVATMKASGTFVDGGDGWEGGGWGGRGGGVVVMVSVVVGGVGGVVVVLLVMYVYYGM